MMNWQEIAVRLDVIHKAAIAGPNYNWLASRAATELEKLRVEVMVEPGFAPTVPDRKMEVGHAQ